MTQAFPELFPDPALANCVAVSADGWRVIAMDTHDTDASEGWSGDPADPAFQAHDWDGQGGVVKPAQYCELQHKCQLLFDSFPLKMQK